MRLRVLHKFLESRPFSSCFFLFSQCLDERISIGKDVSFHRPSWLSRLIDDGYVSYATMPLKLVMVMNADAAQAIPIGKEGKVILLMTLCPCVCGWVYLTRLFSLAGELEDSGVCGFWWRVLGDFMHIRYRKSCSETGHKKGRKPIRWRKRLLAS